MAQKLTTSARIGTGSINHNNRKFIAKNVDSSRTDQNIIFIHEDIKEVYHKLFDDVLQEYNARQTRKDRIINNYYEHIRLSQRLKLFHEVVFQLGDKDFKDKEILKSMLCEFMSLCKIFKRIILIFMYLMQFCIWMRLLLTYI